MAFPTILFNSSTGSDTDSGAGPETALKGTSASYSGSVFTLDGSPDLSGVATDGSHVIWVDTSTGRQFFTINAVDDGADTVAVDDAPAGTSSGLTWGIGGKRASIGSTSSRRVCGADGKASWTVELEDGYTETLSSTLTISASGSAGSSAFTLRGEDGAVTTPVLTFSNNGVGLSITGSSAEVIGIDLENTNASKTASTGVKFSSGNFSKIKSIGIKSSSNNFWRGVEVASWPFTIEECRVENTAQIGIYTHQTNTQIRSSLVNNCSTGVYATGDYLTVDTCCVSGNSGQGIYIASSTVRSISLNSNIIYDNGSHGIYTLTTAARNVSVGGNLLIDNGGYGINFANTSDANKGSALISRNAFYNNTSGEMLGVEDTGDDVVLTADPFVDAPNGDFNVNDIVGGGADLRAANYTLPGLSDTVVYPFRQLVSDAFGGGGSVIVIEGE